MLELWLRFAELLFLWQVAVVTVVRNSFEIQKASLRYIGSDLPGVQHLLFKSYTGLYAFAEIEQEKSGREVHPHGIRFQILYWA